MSFDVVIYNMGTNEDPNCWFIAVVNGYLITPVSAWDQLETAKLIANDLAVVLGSNTSCYVIEDFQESQDFAKQAKKAEELISQLHAELGVFLPGENSLHPTRQEVHERAMEKLNRA